MASNTPKLIFQEWPCAGFTPAGIAAFSDLRPAAVIRELIQNSLDAAREANGETAIVRFRLTEGKTSCIPGIQDYKKAFNRAVETQKEESGGEMPSQANLVVKAIKGALNKDTHNILSVLDNGIGLNKSRMRALLSDGVSSKGNDASGSYGNGHFVAIPVSDLRYIFYGGITNDGNSIGAGHAVLASHHVGEGKNKTHRSGSGFFVLGLGGNIEEMYQCATSGAIPSLIMENLEDIKKTSSHGTAVVIPAFNNFRELKAGTLWQMIAQAAACNFFAAIERGNLVVHVEDLRTEGCGNKKILDRSSLPDVLEKHHKNKHSAFLSGERAFSAHETLRHGEDFIVHTCAGDINVRLLKKRSGDSRIDLCRNGMWITNDKKINAFRNYFKDRKPFHAVLLLDAGIGNDLHGLVREAEGPLHDSISTKYLSKDDKKTLLTALQEIRKYLLGCTEELDDKPFSPNDFLVFDDEDGQAPGGKAAAAFWGRPTAVQQRFPDPSEFSDVIVPGPPKRKPNKAKVSAPRQHHRPVLQSACQCVSTPIGASRRRIHLVFRDAIKNARIRLCVDENIDATCDRLRQDEISPVILSKISVNGKQAEERDIVKENGDVVGVRLGSVFSDDFVTIETDFKLIGDFESSTTSEPSLQVQVFEEREKES